MSNIANAPDPSVTEAHFSQEMDLAHEFLFANWLTKGGSNSTVSPAEFNVRHAVIEVIESISSG